MKDQILNHMKIKLTEDITIKKPNKVILVLFNVLYITIPLFPEVDCKHFSNKADNEELVFQIISNFE